jgi:SAM-dependent methyltransferase
MGISQDIAYKDRLLKVLSKIGEEYHFQKTGKGYGIRGDNNNYYPFVPMAFNTMAKQIAIAYELMPVAPSDLGRGSFLDIGCGIGNVLDIANRAGFWVRGIEYNKKLRPLNEFKDKVFWGDAFDFTEYHTFNCIYMYCPIQNGKLETRLERLVEDSMQVGCIYICNNKQDKRIDEDQRFKPIKNGLEVGNMWQKINQ